MTRAELLAAAKPILFNTEMVRAILDGRKTVTRRVIKPRYRDDEIGFNVVTNAHDGSFVRVEKYDEYESAFDEKGRERIVNPPCNAGDILYVRETWCEYSTLKDDMVIQIEGTGQYYYRADGEKPIPGALFLIQRDGYDEYSDYPKWRPSIHMPKKAARIFLSVTSVRAERVQDITEEGAKAEGIRECYIGIGESGFATSSHSNSFHDCAKGAYSDLWDSTIPKKELAIYEWNSNPWVWVIEFERLEGI